MDININNGYLYAATGQKYIEEAVISVRSLRRINSDIHATLITDNQIEISDFDSIQILKNENQNLNAWKSGLLFKVMALQNFPYNKTFFVDTDTYFCDECEELFELLEYYDLLICHAPADVSMVTVGKKELDGYFPYNTGVIVYNKNDIIKKTFEDWLTIYKAKIELYPHDQASFMEALLTNSVKLYVLQPIYNFRISYFVSVSAKKVKIIHGRPRNFDEIIKIVNSKIMQRVWFPKKNKGKIFIKKQTVKQLIYNYTPKAIIDLYKKLKRAYIRTIENKK